MRFKVKRRNLQALEKCEQDGAYQYLGIREYQRSFSLVLIHQLNNTTSDTVLANIRKSTLNFHTLRKKPLSDAGGVVKILLDIAGQLTGVAKNLEKDAKNTKEAQIEPEQAVGVTSDSL